MGSRGIELPIYHWPNDAIKFERPWACTKDLAQHYVTGTDKYLWVEKYCLKSFAHSVFSPFFSMEKAFSIVPATY
jgi:hypothetical protein